MARVFDVSAGHKMSIAATVVPNERHACLPRLRSVFLLAVHSITRR
jgi:hypothetical protein